MALDMRPGEVSGRLAIEAPGRGRIRLGRLEPSDGDRLCRFFYRLSPETVYRRFLSPIVRPEQARPERLLDVDHRDREAVLSLAGGEILGIARYARWPGREEADLAVVVADAWQRQGLATWMLGALGDLAASTGIRRFSLTMQGDNRPVLGLVRRVYPSARLRFAGGVFEGTVPVTRRAA
jgi:GNAT superfamily N-acetyltransferase